MILDQFGKPVKRVVSFDTVAWLTRDMAQQTNTWDAERRVYQLRDSLSPDFGSLVGATVRVKMPDRFVRLQIADQVPHTVITE